LEHPAHPFAFGELCQSGQRADGAKKMARCMPGHHPSAARCRRCVATTHSECCSPPVYLHATLGKALQATTRSLHLCPSIQTQRAHVHLPRCTTTAAGAPFRLSGPPELTRTAGCGTRPLLAGLVRRGQLRLRLARDRRVVRVLHRELPLALQSAGRSAGGSCGCVTTAAATDGIMLHTAG
jgi:hypothetical protein